MTMKESMRRLTLFGIFISWTACGNNSDTQTQEQEVLQFVRDYTQADERRDLAAVRTFWLQDETVSVIGTNLDVNQLLGWSQIEARLMKVYPLVSDSHTALSGEHAKILANGNAASVVIPKVDVDLTVGGNHIVSTGTRQSFLLERHEDSWKIVHQHWSVPVMSNVTK